MKAWKKIEQRQFSGLYLLYGTENYIINETKQKLVANVLTEEDAEFNLSVYDMEEVSVEEAIEDAETLPFIGETKLVFIQNPSFLTSEKTKDKVEHNLMRLEAYIENPAPYSIVVFSCSYEKLDERKKIVKLLKKNAEIIEAKKMTEADLKTWVREQVSANEVQIDENAIDSLLSIAGTNMANLSMEIEKLSLYANDTNRIDIHTVEKLTSKSLEQNVFALVDKVVHRKIDEALRIYYDLLKMNEEPIKILSLLASQFRLVYQVKELAKRGYGQKQIAEQLKVHPYRVKLASGQAGFFSGEELSEIMDSLSVADLQMKTSSLAKGMAVELFLLKLNNVNAK